jgi:hypothetical protein
MIDVILCDFCASELSKSEHGNKLISAKDTFGDKELCGKCFDDTVNFLIANGSKTK